MERRPHAIEDAASVSAHNPKPALLHSRFKNLGLLMMGIVLAVLAGVLILVLRDKRGSSPPPAADVPGIRQPVAGKTLPETRPDGTLAAAAGRQPAAGVPPNSNRRSNPLDNPAEKARLKEQLIVGLQNTFGPLFVENGLSEQQADEACALMVAQQMEMFDLLRPRPGSPPPPLRDVEQLRTSQEAQLQDKLGDKAFAAFNQYNRDKNASRVVTRLEESARVSGIEFTGDQLQQVRTVLAKERDTRIDVSKLPPIDFAAIQAGQVGQQGEAGPSPTPPVIPENPVLQEVRTILTPEQVQLLDRVLKAPPMQRPVRR